MLFPCDGDIALAIIIVVLGLIVNDEIVEVREVVCGGPGYRCHLDVVSHIVQNDGSSSSSSRMYSAVASTAATPVAAARADPRRAHLSLSSFFLDFQSSSCCRCQVR